MTRLEQNVQTIRLSLVRVEVKEASKLLNELPDQPTSIQVAAIRRMLNAASAKLEVMGSEAALREEKERNK